MKNEKLFMILAYPIIIVVALVAVAFLATPVVLYSFPQMHKFFIASTFMISVPLQQKDLPDIRAHPFYISVGSSTLAVWHMAPKAEQPEKPEHYLTVLKNTNYRIIVYFHSTERDFDNFSSFCRTLLARNDIQIIAFDYKGFGQTAGETTKSGAVEDTLSVFHWLRRHAPGNEIHFWAHGLGGGIAASAAERLAKDDQQVMSIVLEAPFYDTLSMLKSSFWIVEIYSKILPQKFFRQSLDIIDLNFNTTKSIASIDVPTLVLNGESDDIVPASNSRDLVRIARRHRDFVFHIEWRCPGVKHNPGKQASDNEMKQIIDGFQRATTIFWQPN